MKNYTINAIQYHVLSRLLRVSQKSMSERIGVTENYMSRHLQDGEFRVCDALSLCNAYHLRFSSFVTTGEQALSVTELVVPKDKWKGDIRYCPEQIEKLVQEGRLTYKGMMRTMGWSRETVKGILKQDCPVAKLLVFCNTYQFNLSDFVTDPTLPHLTTPASDIREENDRLRNEVIRLREANVQLRRKIMAMCAESGIEDVGFLLRAAEE